MSVSNRFLDGGFYHLYILTKINLPPDARRAPTENDPKATRKLEADSELSTDLLFCQASRKAALKVRIGSNALGFVYLVSIYFDMSSNLALQQSQIINQVSSGNCFRSEVSRPAQITSKQLPY